MKSRPTSIQIFRTRTPPLLLSKKKKKRKHFLFLKSRPTSIQVIRTRTLPLLPSKKKKKRNRLLFLKHRQSSIQVIRTRTLPFLLSKKIFHLILKKATSSIRVKNIPLTEFLLLKIGMMSSFSKHTSTRSKHVFLFLYGFPVDFSVIKSASTNFRRKEMATWTVQNLKNL